MEQGAKRPSYASRLRGVGVGVLTVVVTWNSPSSSASASSIISSTCASVRLGVRRRAAAGAPAAVAPSPPWASACASESRSWSAAWISSTSRNPEPSLSRALKIRRSFALDVPVRRVGLRPPADGDFDRDGDREGRGRDREAAVDLFGERENLFTFPGILLCQPEEVLQLSDNSSSFRGLCR